MSRSKAIGTAAERAVVKTLRTLGFPHAERRALRGELDAGDVAGCPGLVFEVKGGDKAKNAGDEQIAAWMLQTAAERENAGALLGVLVTQRSGVGPNNAHRWWAYLTASAVAALMTNGPCPMFDDTPNPIVRLTLGDVCALLRYAEYADTPEVG